MTPLSDYLGGELVVGGKELGEAAAILLMFFLSSCLASDDQSA